MKEVKGRFAPSPTGRMHLGNVCAALLSWYNAKRRGGKWLLRIEDLDPQRSRLEYAEQLEADLLRLGLEWDEGGLAEGCVQSRRGEYYEAAMATLREKGLIYPCSCTRADILATQAPHQSDGRIVYSGRCRPEGWGMRPAAEAGCFRSAISDSDGGAVGGLDCGLVGRLVGGREIPVDFTGKSGAWRLMVPDRDIQFTDRIAGTRRFNLTEECGDFIVRRKDGAWAYQLAVVVDDALMGVTEVVRGDDLLLSTAQQIYLYRLLGYDVPEFAHFPLIVNEAGQRLSKRDKSQALDWLFEHHSPEEIIGRAAMLTGLRPDATPLRPADLLCKS